jgi:hypothetical protein
VTRAMRVGQSRGGQGEERAICGGRPLEGPDFAHLSPERRVRRPSRAAPPRLVPSASDQLAMYTVGYIPCAVGMGVGTITDAGGGPWSRGRPLGAAAGTKGGGSDVDAYSSAGHNVTDTLYFLGCVCPI